MAEQRRQVVVVGAGYAGLLATVRLAGKTRDRAVDITLVNETDTFVERVRLHQFAAGQTVARRSLVDTLHGTGVNFIQGRVSRIDPARREVMIQTTSGGQQASSLLHSRADDYALGEAGRGCRPSVVEDHDQHIAYDKLLYTLGSTTDRDRVPGVREHAYVLAPAGEHSAAALREALPALDAAKGTLLVCGGGATGIESAAEFAESYPHLHVVLATRGEFGMFLSKKAADYMRHSLERLGVQIQDRTLIREVQAGAAVTTAGTAIAFDVCLWAGGFSAPALAREAGLAVNERGQLLIDPFMRSVSNADIYGAGDAAQSVEVPGARVRMAAFTALILGAHSADCLSAVLHGRSAKPLSFAYAGQGIALGRHDAIGFGSSPDDIPRGPYFTGRAGLTIRELGANLLAALPSLEKRRPGLFTWPGKGRYAASRQRAALAGHVKPI